MKTLRRFAAVAACLCAAALHAEDNVLLIQTGPQGFIVWHTEGKSRISDDEALEVMASARPGGGEEVMTAHGPARGYELPAGVLIRLPEAKSDKALLVDRDACGHIQMWHAEGETQLSDGELTEIVMSALPEGGKRLTLGNRYVKAFVTPLGITATLWKIPGKTTP
jgi:hypothetical protein